MESIFDSEKELCSVFFFSIKNFNNYTSVRSVHILHNPPQKIFKIKNKYLIGFFNKSLKGEYHSEPRQIYPISYTPNSFFDAVKPEYFLRFKSKKKLWGNKILPYITSYYKDIDRKTDL